MVMVLWWTTLIKPNAFQIGDVWIVSTGGTTMAEYPAGYPPKQNIGEKMSEEF
jgi:hypothetical protein